ncbi:nucleotidyl transferase AbiEii/AbiGii toxin family protein [Sorangium sp. So ce1182]|uniref:nucleotidyl transferase AbiEii/AbiGii toxin family protein n=1 Tax=Sorangium sp. So ce1182 TaxID=3133334 RepID=UPI003F5F6D1E
MFRRELYRTMAHVLDALDADVLVRTSFRFGGGTCLALAHGEYRLSRDLDFVCSDPSGYAELRLVVRERGYDALFPGPGRMAFGFPREIRADQYGLRFPVVVGGTSIRVELIREARIALGPAAQAAWTPVPLLSVTDAFAEKLLANSDRWADRDELSRDLVDLAMLRVSHGPIPEAAWASAERAYKSAPLHDLRKAAERFLAEPGYQGRCFAGLDVEGTDDILRGVRALLSDLDTIAAEGER